MKEISPEFSYIIDAARVSADGMELDLNADEAQRKALTARFGIVAIDALSAHVVLKRINKTRLRVSGSFKATVEQTCVVTLEPFAAEVQDSFSVIFAQDEMPSLKLNEIDLDMTEEEEIEPLENGKVDVGELITEYLSLALDPFPRCPEAGFQSEFKPENDKNAFSVLEKLKFQ